MAYGVFIGLAGLDIVYRQSLTPGENLKSKTNRYDLFAGGPAANAAVTYGILGGEAALITCIGDSAIGQTIKKEISEDSPVRILDCAAGQEILPCISSISVNVENGSRTIWSGQQVFQPCIGDAVLEAVREADFCLFDGSLTEVSKDLLPVAKAASRAVVLDMGSWKPDSDLFLSMASEAIASAVCTPPDGRGSFAEAAAGHRLVRYALTNGEHPLVWYEEGQRGEVTPPAVEAIDTLGAGDVYHGAYCYFRYRLGLPFVEALTRAAEVAAKSVAYEGPRQGVIAYAGGNSTKHLDLP